MQEPAPILLGDEVQLRKPHACGANHWIVILTGADIRVRCVQCGRAVLMPRTQFIRARRKLLKAGEPATRPAGKGG
jgi:hypothetical protein